MLMHARIVIVDDRSTNLRIYAQFVSMMGAGFTSVCFQSAKEALAWLENETADLLIVDYRMPEMNGVDFLRAFRGLQPTAARLILSGKTDLAGLVGAINEDGIMRFLTKPWEEADLVFAVEHALAVPVRFVGVGETVGDLLPFDPDAFVAALFA